MVTITERGKTFEVREYTFVPINVNGQYKSWMDTPSGRVAFAICPFCGDGVGITLQKIITDKNGKKQLTQGCDCSDIHKHKFYCTPMDLDGTGKKFYVRSNIQVGAVKG